MGKLTTPEVSKQHINGISYIQRSGQGTPLVFLHGIGSNASSFEPTLKFLPFHLSILAWNAPGYLDSAPLKAHWPSPEDYARALACLLDGMNIDSVNLVGHSLGTLIAAEFARCFPSRVKSLILASSANGYNIPCDGQMPTKISARIEELERLGQTAFAKARAANLVHNPLQHGDIVTRVETTMAQVNPGGYAQAVRMLASGNLSGMIGDVQVCPDFIIGAQDQITPLEQTLNASAAWQDTHGREPHCIVIEEAGHAVYVQQPKRFAEAVLKFIGEE